MSVMPQPQKGPKHEKYIPKIPINFSFLKIQPKQFIPRLCLVHVKYFQENKYFPEMLFLGNENIFKCLVAFQKILWKIFSSVWLFC